MARPADAGPYAELLAAYVAHAQSAFAATQTARSARAAIAEAATSPAYRFRWHTSDQAAAFAGVSLADLDGERVRGVTRTWIW